VYAIVNSRLNKYLWKKKFFDGKSLFPKIKKSQLIDSPRSKLRGIIDPFIVNKLRLLTPQQATGNALAGFKYLLQ